MKIIIFLAIFLCSPLTVYSAEKKGEYLGAIESEIPSWFKDSFLDLAEDVAEASQANKRVMLYFYQPGCPYCAKMIEENFAEEQTKTYIQKHFDIIAINMWGDREMVNIGNKTFTEKQFALALKVQYTPTLMFLDEKGATILRLNGYYPQNKLQTALHYVAEKQEKQQPFATYMAAKTIAAPQSIGLMSEDFYLKTTDLSSLINNQLITAVVFETENCADCKVMHERILSDKATRDIVKKMQVVQLDANSQQQVTKPNGEKISVKNWVKQLNLGYFPSLVFFDAAGKEVMRIEGFLKTFHFQSVFAYVLEKAYLTEPSFQRYISARGEKLREAGFDTDIWGYESEYGQ